MRRKERFEMILSENIKNIKEFIKRGVLDERDEPYLDGYIKNIEECIKREYSCEHEGLNCDAVGLSMLAQEFAGYMVHTETRLEKACDGNIMFPVGWLKKRCTEIAFCALKKLLILSEKEKDPFKIVDLVHEMLLEENEKWVYDFIGGEGWERTMSEVCNFWNKPKKLKQVNIQNIFRDIICYSLLVKVYIDDKLVPLQGEKSV